ELSDQNIHYSGTSMNPHFIVSMAHPNVDRKILASKYGQFIVEVKDPQILLERIKTAWREHPWSLNGYAVLEEVVYNKDESLEPNEYLISPLNYDYIQKPKSSGEGEEFKSYEDDMEFRFVLECSSDANRTLEDHLDLTLPDCSDIASLMIMEPGGN